LVHFLLITDYLAFKPFLSFDFFSISSLAILFNLIFFIRFDPSTFNCSIYVSYTFLEFFSCNLIPLLLLSIESDNLNAICALGCAEHTCSSPSATYALGFAQHTGMTAKHQVFVA
jgi:hypothetical protein